MWLRYRSVLISIDLRRFVVKANMSCPKASRRLDECNEQRRRVFTLTVTYAILHAGKLASYFPQFHASFSATYVKCASVLVMTRGSGQEERFRQKRTSRQSEGPKVAEISFCTAGGPAKAKCLKHHDEVCRSHYNICKGNWNSP